MSGVTSHQIAAEEDGMRLDRWFGVHYPQVPFGRLQKLIRTGQVRVNKARVKTSTRLEGGQEVRVPPLDDAIRTAQRLGWTHHIPRLMVLGNLMTLCEIRPSSAHRWFMEMFVDSSEWVMGPNVYGMGLFSDGGIFATKPYICGSNYLLKMSDYKKGPWCEIVDGLYWRFIDKHREFFSGNPRLALMPRALDRLDSERRTRIFFAAEAFLEQHTVA